MTDLSTPDLPRMSAAIAEPTSHDPDSGGHFGGPVVGVAATFPRR